MLTVNKISFSYGKKRVLSDVSFDVAPGEVTALVGANGAGKTTLLRILSFVLMQDSGNINLDGVDPLVRPVKYRKWIGYLSERCPLYEEMTVEQYLIYRLKLRGERSMRVRRRLNGAMEICELEEVADSLIKSLSQGFKKRIGIADALIQHPRLLLLDDPLAGVDVGRRRRIGAALTDFSSHAAVVLAGHEINEMLEWCTRFIVMKRGMVAALYRTAEFDKEELRSLLHDSLNDDEEGGT